MAPGRRYRFRRSLRTEAIVTLSGGKIACRTGPRRGEISGTRTSVDCGIKDLKPNAGTRHTGPEKTMGAVDSRPSPCGLTVPTLFLSDGEKKNREKVPGQSAKHAEQTRATAPRGRGAGGKSNAPKMNAKVCAISLLSGHHRSLAAGAVSRCISESPARAPSRGRNGRSRASDPRGRCRPASAGRPAGAREMSHGTFADGARLPGGYGGGFATIRGGGRVQDLAGRLVSRAALADACLRSCRCSVSWLPFIALDQCIRIPVAGGCRRGAGKAMGTEQIAAPSFL